VLHTFIRSRLRTLRRAKAIANGPTRSTRGQSLVEFALVLPMLLVMLLGLADFGRVFTAGITLEAAARNGAEAAAQEYVQMVRNQPGGVLDAADFDHLHAVAIDAVCRETETLPDQAEAGGVCTLPFTAVCVHDGNDVDCGGEASAAPAECSRVTSAWDPANNGASPGAPALAYVEVRVCYQFTTLFNLSELRLPFGWGLSLGNIWLERDREFAAANY
jgi:Flp pilus assembly protein TadG